MSEFICVGFRWVVVVLMWVSVKGYLCRICGISHTTLASFRVALRTVYFIACGHVVFCLALWVSFRWFGVDSFRCLAGVLDFDCLYGCGGFGWGLLLLIWLVLFFVFVCEVVAL